MIQITSTVHFSFFNFQFSLFLHLANGTDNCFYPQPGHVGYLLAGKVYFKKFTTLNTMIFFVFFQQRTDPVQWPVLRDFF